MRHVCRATSILVLCLSSSISAAAAPPVTPSFPTPANGATNVAITSALSWATDANAKSFDVFLGTTSTPPLVGPANKFATYTPATLAAGTTYYWRVDAKGTAGAVTAGPLWTFTTAAAAPQPPPPPAPTPAPTSASRLKVMTWNIQSGYDASSQYAADAQVAFMVDANADVIGLHEVTPELSSEYELKLEAATGVPWNAVWAPITTQSAPGGNLVLSRLPITSSSIKQFDTAPNDPSWTGAKRSAARVGLQINGKAVNVFFTHLDTNVNMRTQQLSLLLSWVQTFPAPRLLGGDFNMMPSEADHGTVTAQYDDAWWSLVQSQQASPGPDAGYTKNYRTIAPWVGQPGRIDYWFHEKGSATAVPTEIAVLETQRSDHHAVIMWVRVQ
ncbi:MAG: endonuclease/exonuclease/phosphatase family protein [Acidobacteria bacterium]|nr:endonuclease/exonuclease/phosphatase family protein [Acidobacteriota bacterium]